MNNYCYLNHFTQPDSIVPDPYNPQDWNRYSYVRYNPVKYTDPSGHVSRPAMWIEGDFGFSQMYGIKFTGDFSKNGWGAPGRMMAVVEAVMKVGQKLASERGTGETSASAFQAVFDEGVNFVWDSKCDGCRHGTILKEKNGKWVDTGKTCSSNYTSPGCVPSGGFAAGTTITFASMSGQTLGDLDRMTKNVVHELGYVYYHSVLDGPDLGSSFSRDALRPNEPAGRLDWQQHPDAGGGELFADTFIAWTYNAWNTDLLNVNAVIDARNTMNSYVPLP